MDLFEEYTHSFVIKIWVEETAEEAKAVVWRGRIIHVGSNQKQYFQTVESILTFIWPFLKSIGVEDSRPRHVWRCLKMAWSAFPRSYRVPARSVSRADHEPDDRL